MHVVHRPPGRKSANPAGHFRLWSMCMDTLDQQIISRYTGQPARLPAELRHKVEHLWRGDAVLLYALADLDSTLRLAESWLLLGHRQVAVAEPHPAGGRAIHTLDRTRIRAVHDAPGLSARTLTIVGGRQAAVILRLLGYLRPYQRELSWGLAAAALITLASLVPPYLAGYLIDR